MSGRRSQARPKKADLLLGVDGGGSKTRALIAGADGTVLGEGSTGPSNYQSAGLAGATASLEAAVEQARSEAGLAPGVELSAACFGLAGADRPADRELFGGWAASRGIARRCRFVNDAQLVLAAGTPDGWGLALICGTGSICYGQTPDGRHARAGGWGYLLGDEGSGYDIGVQALRRATQTADGRAAARTILAAILEELRLERPEELIAHVYRPEMTRGMIAGLARRVIALAEGGDDEAQALLRQAAAEWGRLLGAVVRQLRMHEPPVALGGGILGATRWLYEEVTRQAGVTLGPFRYVDDPARGALVLAGRLLETP
jgi:N-acetylglucosamine kinase-like BadF-type ATPase